MVMVAGILTVLKKPIQKTLFTLEPGRHLILQAHHLLESVHIWLCHEQASVELITNNFDCRKFAKLEQLVNILQIN